MTGMPSVGDVAPAFEAGDGSGATIQLGELRGRWIVLYFYPKDDTPGCTREACSFRDAYAGLQVAGALVLGVSGDSEASHRKFAEKYALPFPLLVDRDHAVARAYGAWGTKKQYGREYEGVIRSTFVIDPAGLIAHRWARVKPDGHGDEVLAWLTKNTSS